MANTDITRYNETGSPLSRLVGNTEDYPSFPTLYREMNRWMQDWDNFFNNFFSSSSSWQPTVSSPTSTWLSNSRFNPAMDIRENDKAYMVTAELPGVDPNEVEISLQDNTLLIKGEKKYENQSKGEGYHRMERSYGSFRRALTLPKGVDVEHIDANYNNGLLTLTIPKLPEVQPQARKIQIKSDDHQAQSQLNERVANAPTEDDKPKK